MKNEIKKELCEKWKQKKKKDNVIENKIKYVMESLHDNKLNVSSSGINEMYLVPVTEREKFLKKIHESKTCLSDLEKTVDYNKLVENLQYKTVMKESGTNKRASVLVKK
ncbi:MAG: hypothetical protein ACK5KR_04410 [Breznakia sp.]